MADTPKVGGETDMIQRFFSPLTFGDAGACNLEDDCAVYTPSAGKDLVITTDGVIAGVHFLPDETPRNIAWKVLAANISDLVAKGATPEVYTMNLALPKRPTEGWLEDFSAGLLAAQKHFSCRLVGGDTDRTPGPLSVSVTMFGGVPAGKAVRRTGARAGDLVFVTGVIGSATLGLRLARGDDAFKAWNAANLDLRDALEEAYRRPSPSLQVAELVRDYATASIDVSDGLIKDFWHLCRASGRGGELELKCMPVASAARAALDDDLVDRVTLASGGEDYVVLGTVNPGDWERLEIIAKSLGVEVTCVGSMQPQSKGIVIKEADGTTLEPSVAGWDHFSDAN